MKVKKRIAVFLAACMIFTLIPTMSLADELGSKAANTTGFSDVTEQAEKQYGLFINIDKIYSKVKLFNLAGETRWYDYAGYEENINKEATSGDIVAFEMNSRGKITAMDVTYTAIKVESDLKVISKSELNFNSGNYAIADNAFVFTYEGAALGEVQCKYAVGNISNIIYGGIIVSPCAVYLTSDSKVAALLIPLAVASVTKPTGLNGVAPTTIANNDGGITGTDSIMEYKLSTATDYIPVTGSSINGLAPGTYLVRYAANGERAAGPAAEVVVPEFVEANQYGLVIDIDEGYSRINLLDSDGETIWYEYADNLNVDVRAGKIVAFGLDSYDLIRAIDAKDSSIKVDSGLQILSPNALSFNGNQYNISSNAVVFVYSDEFGPRVYEVNRIDEIDFGGTIDTSASLYFYKNDMDNNIMAMLIPKSALKSDI